jgi:hypothetical protein
MINEDFGLDHSSERRSGQGPAVCDDGLAWLGMTRNVKRMDS